MVFKKFFSLRALIPLLGAFLLPWMGGCATEEGPRELDCQMGFPDFNAEYVAFETGDPAEIVLGFQGFVFTRLLLRVPGNYSAIPKADVDLTIGVEEDEPFGGTQLGVDFTRNEISSDWISEEMYLYFSPAIVDLFKDRDAVITLNLFGPKHYCTTTMTVHLVDKDPCIHTGGTSFLCPEDSE